MDKATSKKGLDSGTVHQDRADVLKVREAKSRETCFSLQENPCKAKPYIITVNTRINEQFRET